MNFESESNRSLAILVLASAAFCAIPSAAMGGEPPAGGESVQTPFESREFVGRWLIAGPFDNAWAAGADSEEDGITIVTGPQDPGPEGRRGGRQPWPESFQAFSFDFLQSMGGEETARPVAGQPVAVDGHEAAWRFYNDANGIVNLWDLYPEREEATAYAYAEIVVSDATEAYLAFGSDDGIKAWFNGERILGKMIGRQVNVDEDFVKVNLREGVNPLLLKIVNQQVHWGFAARMYEVGDVPRHVWIQRRLESLEDDPRLIILIASAVGIILLLGLFLLIFYQFLKKYGF